MLDRYPLGKKPYVEDKRDLLYASYRSTTLPQRPASFGHETVVSNPTAWGMLGNDEWGDCVFAGAGHEVELWTRIGGVPANVSAIQALKDYSAVTGFDPSAGGPGQNPTDQGAVVRDALRFRQATGTLDSHGKRHKLYAYLKLDPTDINEILEAAYLFDAVGIGFEVEEQCFAEYDAGKPWAYHTGANLVGGHYVPIVARRYPYIDVITWGRIQRVTTSFITHRCDEAWALLSLDFLRGGKSPLGFDLTALKADLQAVTSL